MNERLDIARLLTGYFRLVMHSLLHRRLRASLTIVGIVIGISIVLTLVFLGNGLQKSITGQLQQFGTDLIFALPHDAANPFAGATSGGKFSDDDVQAAEGVTGVLKVMPIVTAYRIPAVFRGEEKTVSIEARPRDLIQLFLVESLGLKLAEGRWMKDDASREMVLGATIAEKGFRDPVRVGDTIDFRGHRVTVTGILAPFGDRTRDNMVLITLDLFRKLTGVRGDYGGMLVKIETGRDIEAVGRDLEDAFSRQRDLEEYSVLTPSKSQQVVGNVVGTVQSALFLIASVAVVIAGIGVMNTMYTSVLERTREIGVMKSVGAKGWHIMTVFILESMLLGGLGGLLGTIGGGGLALIVAAVARAKGFTFFEAAIDLKTIVFVLAFTMAVGVLAGILPAREAAKRKPVDALRYR
ncbi:MAG TPA: ABC transporter permease [Patescibacteria group bacterium]|nr:ABC transporter permease [Patescibacteria group bacterium]